MRKSTSAFTILEIIIVITVIGILTSIGVFSYTSVTARSRDSKREANITILAEYLEKYYENNGEYPSCAAMTQSPSVVASEVLVGIDADVLTSPTDTSGASSIICSELASDADKYAYLGDGSTSCLTGTSCLQFSLEYKHETDSTISLVNSKHLIDNVSLSPSHFTNTALSNTSATFTWTASTFATSNTIQCALNANYTTDVVSSAATGTTGTINGLTANRSYYCHIRGVNATSVGSWTTSINVTTTANFGTIAAATNLAEPSIGATSSTFSWTGITCSLGSALYRVNWISPYTTSTSWMSNTSTSIANDQGITGIWKVESKCAYDDLESSSSLSSSHSYSVPVSAPSGSWGSIGWDDRFGYNANSNSFTCTASAQKQFLLVMTLLDYTYGTWTFGWTTSSAIGVTNANQGARMTDYMQVRCVSNGVSSSVLSSGSRTDYASVDAPGAVPGWCAGTCGTPKGDRWSAVACPAGTYAVYWSYARGDKLGDLWGPHEAADFYGYDRPGYYDMINDYLMARCTSNFRTSGWGPQSYAYY